MPAADGQMRGLIDAFLQQVETEYDRDHLAFNLHFHVSQVEAGRAILQLPREQQVEFVLVAVRKQVDDINDRETCASLELGKLLSDVLRKKLPFTGGQLQELLGVLARIDKAGWWSASAPAGVVKAVENHVTVNGLGPGLRATLGRLAETLRSQTSYAEPRQLLKRVEAIL